MKLKLLGTSAMLACATLPHTAHAEPTPEAASPAPATGSTDARPMAPAVPPCCIVPSLTVIELEIVDPASSRTSQIGDSIRIRTAEPVTVDGKIMIPAGTEGHAEVIQASKARMMGKAGELTLGMARLELHGQRIPLKRLRYGRSSGHSATTETMVATALVGIPGMLITGGNVDVQSGARANALVAAETHITIPTTDFDKGEK